MSGRTLNPGEQDVWELVDQRNIKNRTLRAQVKNVDNENGFVILNMEGSPGGGKYATIDPLWMSFPRDGGAAWGRFMPQPSDLVKVSFDYDDSARIVGYDVSAAKPGTADSKSGWPYLNSLYNTAIQDPSKKIAVTDSQGNTTQVSIAKYAQFAPLNGGEFDFMSSGGAYIYGNNTGRLYMAGGGVSIALNKNNMLIEGKAQCYTQYADDCLVRYGQVRRPDPSTQVDKTIAIDSGGLFKEFTTRLKTTTAPGVALDLGTLQLGNIVVDAGTITEQLDGADLRFLLRTFNSGVQTFQMAADVTGNMQMDASGSTTINATAIKLQGPKGSPSATHPLILSKTYESAEKQLVSGLVQQINALTQQVTILTSILNTLGGAMVADAAAGAAMVAALTPVSAALAPLPAGTTAVGNTFSNAYNTYLSTISSTG